MAFPDDLLEQARHLAAREKRRPRQASLRRSVSAAYYAFFHLLISEAAANWKRRDQRMALARAFNHGQMRTACDSLISTLRKRRKKRGAAGRLNSVEIALERIASAFIELQDDRTTADYDGTVKWSRIEALTAVDAATSAFKTWRTIREEPEAQDFLLSLLVKRR